MAERFITCNVTIIPELERFNEKYLPINSSKRIGIEDRNEKTQYIYIYIYILGWRIKAHAGAVFSLL